MSSSASVNVTDAGGQTFSIGGCSTVGALKDAILLNTGIPINKQRLARKAAGDVELDNSAEIAADEEMELLLVDVNGGCEVAPFFIKISGFECKFRCSICFSGMDLEWNKCQYCCVHAGCSIL